MMLRRQIGFSSISQKVIHFLRSVDHDLAEDDTKDAPPPVLDARGLDVDVPEDGEGKFPISRVASSYVQEAATSLTIDKLC